MPSYPLASRTANAIRSCRTSTPNACCRAITVRCCVAGAYQNVRSGDHFDRSTRRLPYPSSSTSAANRAWWIRWPSDVRLIVTWVWPRRNQLKATRAPSVDTSMFPHDPGSLPSDVAEPSRWTVQSRSVRSVATTKPRPAGSTTYSGPGRSVRMSRSPAWMTLPVECRTPASPPLRRSPGWTRITTRRVSSVAWAPPAAKLALADATAPTAASAMLSRRFMRSPLGMRAGVIALRGRRRIPEGCFGPTRTSTGPEADAAGTGCPPLTSQRHDDQETLGRDRVHPDARRYGRVWRSSVRDDERDASTRQQRRRARDPGRDRGVRRVRRRYA